MGDTSDVNMVTKLTFPGEGPGETRIRAYLDGKLSGPPVIVGSCTRVGTGWRVTLWSRAGQETPGDESYLVPALSAQRQPLLERIGRDGKWWQ